jgi:hypothetical protein
LVTDPTTELKALCDFLGEAFDPSMLDSHLVAHVIPEWQSWHANTRREVTNERVGGHLADLEPWELRLVEYVAGGRLRSLGYDVPASPGFPRPTALVRYWIASARLRIATSVRAARDRVIARPDGSMRDLVPRWKRARARRRQRAAQGATGDRPAQASRPAAS